MKDQRVSNVFIYLASLCVCLFMCVLVSVSVRVYAHLCVQVLAPRLEDCTVCVTPG